MNEYELLVAARDAFAAHGGAKHVLVDELNRVCAVGAINLADHGNAEWTYGLGYKTDDSVYVVRDLLNLQFADPEDDYAIVDYNNRHDTTKEDVLAVFDKAIAAFEEKVSNAGAIR